MLNINNKCMCMENVSRLVPLTGRQESTYIINWKHHKSTGTWYGMANTNFNTMFFFPLIKMNQNSFSVVP